MKEKSDKVILLTKQLNDAIIDLIGDKPVKYAIVRGDISKGEELKTAIGGILEIKEGQKIGSLSDSGMEVGNGYNFNFVEQSVIDGHNYVQFNISTPEYTPKGNWIISVKDLKFLLDNGQKLKDALIP